jgi:hypothetical protein
MTDAVQANVTETYKSVWVPYEPGKFMSLSEQLFYRACYAQTDPAVLALYALTDIRF